MLVSVDTVTGKLLKRKTLASEHLLPMVSLRLDSNKE
jgi:hypothetical protein